MKIIIIPVLALIISCSNTNSQNKTLSDSTNCFTMTVNKAIYEGSVIESPDDDFKAGALLFKKDDKYFFALTLDSCNVRMEYNCAEFNNVEIAKEDNKIAITGYWQSSGKKEQTAIIINTKNNYGIFTHPDSDLGYMGYFTIGLIE